jgi:hypothetical protein
MYHSDYWFDLPKMWANWPDREMDGLFKWYYLVQYAFWLQQIVVVNIEEIRKDYLQMFTHHVVTCFLMFWSYGYHQTKVGNVILVIMDGVDMLLSVRPIFTFIINSLLSLLTNASLQRYSNILVMDLFATSYSAFSWFLGSYYDIAYT